MIAAVVPAASLSGLHAAPDAPPGAGGDAPAFSEAFERAEAPRGKAAAGRGKGLPVGDEGEGASGERRDTRDDEAPVADLTGLIPVALTVTLEAIAPMTPSAEPTPSSSCRPCAGIHGAADTAAPALAAQWTPAQGRGDGVEQGLAAAPLPGGRASGRIAPQAILGRAGHVQPDAGPGAGGPMLDLGVRREGATHGVSGLVPDRMLVASEPTGKGALQPPATALLPERKAEPQLAALPLTPAARAAPAPLPRVTTGRSLRERATEVTGPTLAPTPTAPAAFAPVAAQPLDVSTQAWPAAMMARIEALREAADAVDTSIRILPDALGAIDVSVRKDGEVTHVHLAAEQAQTARLLAEAQPRLAELADARGLRLQTSTAGTGGGNAQPDARSQPQPQQPAAPPPASPRARAETPDHRIA